MGSIKSNITKTFSAHPNQVGSSLLHPTSEHSKRTLKADKDKMIQKTEFLIQEHLFCNLSGKWRNNREREKARTKFAIANLFH